MRILNYEINEKIPLKRALTSIYGVSKKNVRKILHKLKIGQNETIHSITSDNIIRLKDFFLQQNNFGNYLFNKVKSHIKDKIIQHTYTGYRHLQGYPVRGQRTRSNHKTAAKKNIKLM